MIKEQKRQSINLRLTVNDKDMITKYCENKGVTYSDVIRDLIKKNIFVPTLKRYPGNAGEQPGEQ